MDAGLDAFMLLGTAGLLPGGPASQSRIGNRLPSMPALYGHGNDEEVAEVKTLHPLGEEVR